MGKQLLHPLAMSDADLVNSGHSLSLIHITHAMVIIHLSVYFYYVPLLILDISFLWWIVNIRLQMSVLPIHFIEACPSCLT